MHYFILALSKNHARLFEVTAEHITPLEVDGMPNSMANQWAGMEREEGRAGDVTEEEEDAYLHHVAKSIHTIVHDSKLPLIFAGVAEEYGMIKKFDQSGMLLDAYIKGSAEHMPMEELKEKADPIVKEHMMKEGEKHLEEYGNLLGTGRTSADVDVILIAAEKGKVELLFITDGTDGQDSRVQEAMAFTSAHRGRIVMVRKEMIPEGAVIAAILRL